MCIKVQISDIRKSLFRLVKVVLTWLTALNLATSVICLSVVLRKLFQINGPR